MQARPSRPFFIKYSAADASRGAADAEAEDEDEEDIPLALSPDYRVATENMYDSMYDVLRAVRDGEINLRRAEWIRTAFIGPTVFFDGEVTQHDIQPICYLAQSKLCS